VVPHGRALPTNSTLVFDIANITLPPEVEAVKDMCKATGAWGHLWSFTLAVQCGSLMSAACAVKLIIDKLDAAKLSEMISLDTPENISPLQTRMPSAGCFAALSQLHERIANCIHDLDNANDCLRGCER
jgi:hypothetical protein